MLSPGLSLHTRGIITSNLDFIPSLCQERIKSGFILWYTAYQEKTELYKIIQASFFSFLGKEIPAATLIHLIYFDFLILNHHFLVFYAETVQWNRNNSIYVQLALGEYFFHLFLGERHFTAQPECEE